MAEVHLSAAQSPLHLEDNGVLYVTKRISSNHKVTVPLRKRKGLKEEQRTEDSQETATASSPTENASINADKQSKTSNTDCNLRTILNQDPSLCYAMQHEPRALSNYNCSTANQGDKQSAGNNPVFKKMGYGYSSIKRYHDFFNTVSSNQVHSENANNGFSQNAMPMPLYYYYNNSYLIGQIVKELQITIQNVLLKNATIYSGYDTGISNSLEIHNPSDGSVVLIQFQRQNILENSFMEFGNNQMKHNTYNGSTTIEDNSPSDEVLLPINNFEIVENMPTAQSEERQQDRDMKPCFVKLDKMPEDDMSVMTEILPVEVTYSDDDDDDDDDDNDESVVSDSNSTASKTSAGLINQCKKCGLTFKLKIQLAHHKCLVNDDDNQNTSQTDVDAEPSSENIINSLERDENEQISVTSYVNNNNFSGVTIYQVSVPEQLHELSQFSCAVKCETCGSETENNNFCSTCQLTHSNSDGDTMMADGKDGDHDKHSDFPNGKLDAQNYKECPFCKKRFSPYYSLKYHTSKCRSMNTARQKSVKNNLNARHSIPGRSGNTISCKLCNKTFANNNKLRRHMIIHSGVKRYICNQCGKRFGRSDHLKLHRETHSGLKPFVCVSCGKAFTSRQSLKLHMRLHNGEAPYMCNFCHKTFVQLASLKTHLKVHCKSKGSKNKLPVPLKT